MDFSLGEKKLRSEIQRWLAVQFGPRVANNIGASCWDNEFGVRQWQRAVGNLETGKITEADVRRWMDLDAQQAAKAQADTLAKKQQKKLQEERLAPFSVFGITFGMPFDILPCDFDILDNGRQQTARQNEGRYTSESVPYRRFKENGGRKAVDYGPVKAKRTVIFSVVSKPGWLNKEFSVTTVDNRVVTMDFTIEDRIDPAVGMQAFDERLGLHNTEVVPMRRNASVSCFGGNCSVMPADEMKGYKYRWRSNGLTAKYDCLPFCDGQLSITLDKAMADEEEKERQRELLENQKILNTGKKL